MYPDKLRKPFKIKQMINIGVGIDATVLQTILFTAKAIVLFLSIMYTTITLRSVGQLAGAVAIKRDITWPASMSYRPAALWTLFWLICQIPV